MWAAVLMLAISAMGDPLRIAIAVFLCSRRRPMTNLFLFWLGGIATNLIVGLVALFLLRDFSLVVMRAVASAANYDVAQIQIAVGVVALLIASLIAAGFAVRQRAPVAVSAGNLSELPIERSTPRAFSRLSTRAREALQGGSPWVALLAGVWMAPGPPVEMAGTLAAILASGAGVGAQVGAMGLYSFVAFGIVAIPLLSHMVAPAKSQVIMLQVDSWLRARRRALFASILAVVGAYLVATGVGIV